MAQTASNGPQAPGDQPKQFIERIFELEQEALGRIGERARRRPRARQRGVPRAPAVDVADVLLSERGG